MTDLKQLAGDRYRVQDDGTQDPNRSERPWCLEIRGRYGAIYPCGFNGDLAVRTDSLRMARRLAGLGLKLLQAGDESSFRFPAALLDTVAAMIRARRRRVISAEERTKRVARLAGSPFRALRNAVPGPRSDDSRSGGVRARGGGADAS